VARRPLTRRLFLGPAQLAHRLMGIGKQRATPAPASTPAETFALHFAWSNELHMREQLAGPDRERVTPEP
jgi:hypothetical protein